MSTNRLLLCWLNGERLLYAYVVGKHRLCFLYSGSLLLVVPTLESRNARLALFCGGGGGVPYTQTGRKNKKLEAKDGGLKVAVVGPHHELAFFQVLFYSPLNSGRPLLYMVPLMSF